MSDLREAGVSVPVMTADREPMRFHTKIADFEAGDVSGELLSSFDGTLFCRLQSGERRQYFELSGAAFAQAAIAAFRAAPDAQGDAKP